MPRVVLSTLASALLTTLVVTLAVTLVVTPAQAHVDAGEPYTQRSCPGAPEARTDPVNVVFHGWGTWGRAAGQVESHAGWTTTSGSTQSFVDHGTCRPFHAQRASGLGSRFHLRVRGQHRDELLGWISLGAVHHEDLVLLPLPCGHAVDSNGPAGSGFDQGRDELRDRLTAAGHASFLGWWGNTQSFKQCDGDYAGSDGWVLFVELHQVSH
jgi:hypothetical protein